MAQVSDFNVANASGASVRSDINAILEAIKTCNSGGSDPSNPEQFMFYADTADNNNLKIRNAANTAFTTIGSVDEANLGLLPRAGGTMTGNILGNDGTGAASPSYSFDTDTDTGMYRAASNTIGFSTAGVERVLISNNGLDLKDALAIRFQDSSGSPFVSLKSPSSLSGNVDLTLPSSIVSGGFMQTDGSGNLSFTTLGGAYNDWSIKTTTYTASNKDQLIANHASTPFTITLPASPSAGNTVIIANAGAATVTVGRNSSNINSAAADGTLPQGNSVQLVYVDGTIGWFEI